MSHGFSVHLLFLVLLSLLGPEHAKHVDKASVSNPSNTFFHDSHLVVDYNKDDWATDVEGDEVGDQERNAGRSFFKSARQLECAGVQSC